MLHVRALVAVVAGAALMVSCSVNRTRGPKSAVPPETFRALCDSFAGEEGFERNTPLLVLAKTRPIFSTVSLRQLHSGWQLTLEDINQDDALDRLLTQQFRPLRLNLPAANKVCNFRLVEGSLKSYVGSLNLILELSNPIVDPFAPRGSDSKGLFARLSVGGAEGAGWYWVAFESDQVKGVFPLDISDD